MVCNNQCKLFRAKRPVGGQRYNDGQKRCSVCIIWIRWDGKYCPCCGYILRCHPRKPMGKMLLKPMEVRYK